MMSAKVLGSMLLVVALILLLADFGGSEMVAVLQMLAFGVCWLAAWMLIAGLAGSPAQVVELRRNGELLQRQATPRPPLQVEEFVRPRPAPWIWLVAALGGLPLFALAIWVVWYGGQAWHLWLSLVLILAGAVYLLYFFCHYRSNWSVTPQGLQQDGCRRRYQAWDDVLYLRVKKIAYLYDMPIGEPIYTVYSRHSKLTFTGRIERVEVLAAAISAATGLEWQLD